MKTYRLNRILKEANIELNQAVNLLHEKGYEVQSNPLTIISLEEYKLLIKEFLGITSSEISGFTIYKGMVIAITDNWVIVRIDVEIEGILKKPSYFLQPLEVGMLIDVVVTEKGDISKPYILDSRTAKSILKHYEAIKQIELTFNSKCLIEASIKMKTSDGYILSVLGERAFLPSEFNRSAYDMEIGMKLSVLILALKDPTLPFSQMIVSTPDNNYKDARGRAQEIMKNDILWDCLMEEILRVQEKEQHDLDYINSYLEDKTEFSEFEWLDSVDNGDFTSMCEDCHDIGSCMGRPGCVFS